MKQDFFNRLLHLLDCHPKQGKRIVGISKNALWELWQRVARRESQVIEARRNNPERQRESGAGRKKKAPLLCRLLVALIYLRQHWTMQGISEVIDCAESTVWNYIHEQLPYLRSELPASLLEQWQTECPSVERGELEAWLAALPWGALLVDSWEQPIHRPQGKEEQKAYYSGKKRRHTRKNQAITLPQGLDIVDVVVGERGPRSDSKLFEQTQAELPSAIPFIGDKAYVGRENTVTPAKKPKGGELTKAQKERNRKISQKRVYVEHVIRVIKIFRVAKEEFRMRAEIYQTVINTVCGLVRLRGQYA